MGGDTPGDVTNHNTNSAHTIKELPLPPINLKKNTKLTVGEGRVRANDENYPNDSNTFITVAITLSARASTS